MIFILFGLLFLLFGILFFFAPKAVIKISEIGNKMIFTDHGTIAHRHLSGLLLFVMSIIMFYLAFYV